MKLVKWFKKLRHIVSHYDQDKATLQKQINSGVALIKERTTVHADIGFRPGESQIIVVGRYRNRDYINIFDIGREDFVYTVDMLKAMEKTCHRGRIDSPPLFSAVLERVDA